MPTWNCALCLLYVSNTSVMKSILLSTFYHLKSIMWGVKHLLHKLQSCRGELTFSMVYNAKTLLHWLWTAFSLMDVSLNWRTIHVLQLCEQQSVAMLLGYYVVMVNSNAAHSFQNQLPWIFKCLKCFKKIYVVL